MCHHHEVELEEWARETEDEEKAEPEPVAPADD
jgi:hypothetical protein